MEKNSWIIIFTEFWWLWITGLSFFIVYSFLKYRGQYQCPECKKYFGRDCLETRIVREPTTLKDGEKIITYKCRKCRHEWKVFIVLKAGLTNFIDDSHRWF